jgi:hypothetical protein
MIGEIMEKSQLGKTIREAILIFLMVLLGYGYFSSERDSNVNSRLALIKAFVDEDRLEIDSYHDTELYTSDKSYFKGHYYSDKAVGTAVLGIFAYYPVRWVYAHEGIRLTPRLFREWMTFFIVSLPTAFIAPFLYALMKQITASPTRSLVITLSICLGTPLYKYGTALYGHTLATVLYFLAFLIWYYARRQRYISMPLAFISAFLLGFTVITEFPALVLVILVSPYILFTLYQTGQLTSWKVYVVMAVGFVLPICLQFYYNNTIFGAPFTTGYSHEYIPAFREAHGTDFMGIGWPDLRVFFYQTIHPSLGIFWQSPILLLAIIGWFFMAKKEEYHTEMYFSMGVIVLYILFFSGYFDWWGGVVFSPRHLIPIMPFFALPLAFTPKRVTIPLLMAGLISVFQNLLMAASGFEGLYEYIQTLLQGTYVLANKGMLFYEICLPNVIKGNLMNNRGIQLLGLQGPLSLLPLLTLEFVILIIYFRLIQLESKST